MGLFQLGDFTLHSGAKSKWKIECDALTDDDIEALALMISEMVGPFQKAHGVPRGGLRLAEALNAKHRQEDAAILLIVDDVLTTGNSMVEFRSQFEEPCKGAVVFARGNCPLWVFPLFKMNTKSPFTTPW